MRHDFAHHFGDFTVTLTKDQILSHLRKNRTEHVKVYKEAKEGYLRMAADAVACIAEEIAGGKLRKITSDLKLPVCYEEQYVQLIQMFELAKEEEFELEMAQYRCIVDDAWGWTDSFNVTNAVYSMTAAGKL
jgi:predicted butyrate kinase (DUF1464 family)